MFSIFQKTASGLLKTAPFQSATMMSLLVDRMRHSAMRIVCRAFRPRITLKSLGLLLGFEDGDPEQACRNYLDGLAEETKGGKKLVCVYVNGDGTSQKGVPELDTKETQAIGYFRSPFVFKMVEGDTIQVR